MRWALFLLLATQLSAAAQTPATNVNATPAPASAVLVEVRVLAVPTAGLKNLELFFPESAEAPGRPRGFAIVLSDDEAQALARDPGTIAIHNLRLIPNSGNPSKFRVEARTAVTASYPVNQPYFEVALGFELGAKPISDSIALTTGSVVQIRRGPGAGGGVPALLLETSPIRHNIQVPAGKSILLGGFFTPADSARLPEISPKPESPLLSYVLSKGQRGADDPEIVVLLIPKIIDAPAPAPERVPRITAAPTEQPKIEVATKAPAPVIETLDPTPTISALITTPAVVAPDAEVRATQVKAIEVKPPSPAPKVEPVVKPGKAAYAVQLGAFRSARNAQALAGKLEGEFEGLIVEEIPGGETPFRVRISGLPTLAAAKQVRDKLSKRGFTSFVVLPESR